MAAVFVKQNVRFPYTCAVVVLPCCCCQNHVLFEKDLDTVPMIKPIDAKIWREHGEHICLNDHPVCQFCLDVVYCVQKGLLGNVFEGFFFLPLYLLHCNVTC